MRAIANTTVLSNFARVGRIDLLRAVLANLYIPTEVYAEIQAGLEEGYAFLSQVEAAISPLFEDGWIVLVALEGDAEFSLFGQISDNLHPGEAACLTIAKQAASPGCKLSEIWPNRLNSDNLHPGEAACLTIAKQRDWLLLTDDQAARKLATKLGLELSGTLGILVQAVKTGLLALDEANTLLDQMIANGYRSPFATIDALLE